MKFKKYIEEGKEAKFIKGIEHSVSMAQVRRYKELAHSMTMTETERRKIKEVLDKKMKELGKGKK